MKIFLILLLLFPAALYSMERNITYEIVGFSKDSRYVLVKAEDEERGTYFELYQVFDTKKKAMEFFTKENEKQVFNKFKYKYKITKKWVKGPKSPDGKYSVLGMQDGKYFRIFFMKGAKFGYYTKIKLEKEKAGGPYAEAFLKQVGWTFDGKYFIIILHQKLEGKKVFIDSDYIYSYKFEPFKIKYLNVEEKKK